MYMKIILPIIFVSYIQCAIIITPPPQLTFQTLVEAKNSTSGLIDYELVKKPHHLFIGRCSAGDPVLHQENIILNNDKKSQVAASIMMNVEANVSISCVKIFDAVPDGQGGYPSYVSGGVGYNYIEFNIANDYGKGFHFYVQIFGHNLDIGKNNN